jgi:Flp pilus assembly protein CpaB
MLHRSPRVLALRLLAAALAVVTIRLVATDLGTLHRRAGSLGPVRAVVEARRDLPLGTLIQADDLRTVSRHRREAPALALERADDAIGRTVIVPIVATAPVMPAHLADQGRRGNVALIAPDHRGVRIVPSDGLRPPVGAIVDVIASLDPTTASAVRASVIANGAVVLAVDGGDDGTEVGVVLEVTTEEATRVAFAAANGQLTLALVPPEDA